MYHLSFYRSIIKLVVGKISLSTQRGNKLMTTTNKEIERDFVNSDTNEISATKQLSQCVPNSMSEYLACIAIKLNLSAMIYQR